MTLQKNFHSQVYSPADLAYQDCVVKSGVDPDVYHLNFDPASGTAAYEQNYGDSDKTTNSGSSIEALGILPGVLEVRDISLATIFIYYPI